MSDSFATSLLQRLRRLNRAERTVLMRASFIGRHFSLAVLTDITVLTEERVREVLDKACTLQFIVRESRCGDWYAFRHALIRDIAYAEFIGTHVRPIHRRIARALERCAETSETALDNLAYHSWAGGDAARCLRYNELAGDQATAAFASQGAQAYYARAREFVGPHSEEYRRLTNKIARLHSTG
ncbi:MAG: hypothetical protein JOZ77_02915 [Candidatus Eremiobacteraeota bacterium]|nr:hypothetical protein [Candidatus Eremiobacteraeota bacterium]